MNEASQDFVGPLLSPISKLLKHLKYLKLLKLAKFPTTPTYKKKDTLELFAQEYFCLFECSIRYLAAREHLRNLAHALRLR